MRNFKKVMALAISVAAVCSSVSAFAEFDYSYSGALENVATYDASEHTLTLNVAGAAGDKTVLVLDNGIADTDATGENILYINQYTADEAYGVMGLKGEALAAGEYLVKFGYEDANGDFAIAEGKIIVAEKKPEEPQFVTIELWGDINGDETISVLDASAIVSAILGTPEETEIIVGELVQDTDVIWGDINSDETVSVLDASAVVSAILGTPEETTYIVGEPAQLPKVSE